MEEARSIALARVRTLQEVVHGLNNPESPQITQHWMKEFHGAANALLSMAEDPNPQHRHYVNGIAAVVRAVANDYPFSIVPPQSALQDMEQQLQGWLDILNAPAPPRKEGFVPEERMEIRAA